MSSAVMSQAAKAKFEIGDRVENRIMLGGWLHKFNGVVIAYELREDGVYYYRCRDEVVWAAERDVRKVN
jgi:hypothetical protein